MEEYEFEPLSIHFASFFLIIDKIVEWKSLFSPEKEYRKIIPAGQEKCLSIRGVRLKARGEWPNGLGPSATFSHQSRFTAYKLTETTAHKTMLSAHCLLP
jgi:hypothetical protein